VDAVNPTNNNVILSAYSVSVITFVTERGALPGHQHRQFQLLALHRTTSHSLRATMSADHEQISRTPDQLIEQMLKGYDSLHTEFKALNDQSRELEHKLAWAKQQVRLFVGYLHHYLCLSDEILLALDLRLHRSHEVFKPKSRT
jgi:hypothetical protein